MNYSTLLTIAARTERAHTAAQNWIKTQAPVLEQRLKTAALKATIARCESALNFVDCTLPVWILTIQLFIVKAKRFAVWQAIKLCQFNERHGITTKAADFWSHKSELAVSAMDKVFGLDYTRDEQLTLDTEASE